MAADRHRVRTRHAGHLSAHGHLEGTQVNFDVGQKVHIRDAAGGTNLAQLECEIVELQHHNPNSCDPDHVLVRLPNKAVVSRAIADVEPVEGAFYVGQQVRPPAEPTPEHATSVTNVPEMRSPLETHDGGPNPLRVATLAFEQLGAGRRARVVVELDLMTDERARMSADQLIRSVAAEVVERDLVDQFLRAVERQV